MKTFAAWLFVLAQSFAGCSASPPAHQDPLMLERTIPVADVAGRIDHLAYDPRHGRLFIAALGNGTVEVVDLVKGAVAARIGGLKEPQGLAYLSSRDEIAVASGGDGTVRFYRAGDLAPVGEVALGADADNLRVQPGTGRLVVGYGAGTLAIIDPATRRPVSRVRLPAHPEGFQLDGDRGYVNLPGAGGVGVVDLKTSTLKATWPNAGRRFNFPLAVDRKVSEVAIVYRLPGRLVTLDPDSGAVRQALPACGDADDLFLDERRSRMYVICGDGKVDVFERRGATLHRLARIESSSGARTALFIPDLDRLYVAAPARTGHPAAILIFRPQ